MLSCSVTSDSAMPWTVARQSSPSTGFSRQEYWSGLPLPPPGDLPNLGIKPRSPALQVDSLPAEPQRKPKNTGVGSLSLLQWIFPTQESNWGLLHGRQILYQLSYEGSLHPAQMPPKQWQKLITTSSNLYRSLLLKRENRFVQRNYSMKPLGEERQEFKRWSNSKQ